MKLIQELINLTEADAKSVVSKSTRSAVYHADYVKTKKKQYRRYQPKSKSPD